MVNLPRVLLVLIESDWNLKYFIHEGIRAGWLRINRIRLEFKGEHNRYEHRLHLY